MCSNTPDVPRPHRPNQPPPPRSRRSAHACTHRPGPRPRPHAHRYGRNLAETLGQHVNNPEALPFFAFVTSIFSTSNVSLILARITRGLRPAAALEAKLLRPAARGQHLAPNTLRPPSSTKPRQPSRDPSFPRLPALPRRPPPRTAAARSVPCWSAPASISASSPSRWFATPGKNCPALSSSYRGNLLTLLHRRESKFVHQFRQRRGDPVASLIRTDPKVPSPCARGAGPLSHRGAPPASSTRLRASAPPHRFVHRLRLQERPRQSSDHLTP